MAVLPARLRREADFVVTVPDRADGVGWTWRLIPSIEVGISFYGEPQVEAKFGNAVDLPLIYGMQMHTLQKILFNQATIDLKICGRHVGHLTHIVVVANFDAGNEVRIRFKLLRLDVSHLSALQLQTKPR